MFRIISLALALAITSAAWAGDATGDKPSLSASRSVTLTATVEKINHKTREVTLRNPDGELVEIVADDEVRNLDQVSVGDTLNIEYVQGITIDVIAATNAEPGAAQLSAEGRAEKGEMPGAAAVDSIIVNTVVTAINMENNTFKLKFPDGSEKEFTARDPENLKKSAVGDLVVITLTEAVALSIDKKASE